MEQIQTVLLNITLDAIFGCPRPFDSAYLRDQSAKLLNGLAQFGVTASDISLKRNDELYDYELSIRMFRGVGNFKLTSDKATTVLKDARTASDFATVRDCLIIISSLLDLTPGMVTSIIIELHANLQSQSRAEFFSKLLNKVDEQILEGAVLYRSSTGFQGDIRLALERSNIIIGQNSISIFWNGAIMGSPTADTANAVYANMEAGLRSFQLEFKKD